MATGTLHRRPPSGSAAAPSLHAVIWRRAVACLAVVWIVVAVAQTPRWPLLCLVGAVASFGGTAFVRAPLRTPRGRRQYAWGAVRVAAGVVVVVGIGHHLGVGLGLLALVALSSPAVAEWVGSMVRP
jgi:hypothetical protein